MTAVPQLLHSIAALMPASYEELVNDFGLPEMPTEKLLGMPEVFGFDALNGRYFLRMSVPKLYEVIRRAEAQ